MQRLAEQHDELCAEYEQEQVGSITLAFVNHCLHLCSFRRFNHARFDQSLLAFATTHSLLFSFVPHFYLI
jgi:hypothetical protein